MRTGSPGPASNDVSPSSKEGLVEAEHHHRRIGDYRRMRPLGNRDLHQRRHLVRQVMDRCRRDTAHDRARSAVRHCDHVGVRRRGRVCSTEDPAREFDDLPAISPGIQISRMHTVRPRGLRRERRRERFVQLLHGYNARTGRSTMCVFYPSRATRSSCTASARITIVAAARPAACSSSTNRSASVARARSAGRATENFSPSTACGAT